MRWIYDDIDKCWLTGTKETGAGVLQDKQGKWVGNVVYNKVHSTVGPLNTADEAMDACELEMARKKKDNLSIYNVF